MARISKISKNKIGQKTYSEAVDNLISYTIGDILNNCSFCSANNGDGTCKANICARQSCFLARYYKNIEKSLNVLGYKLVIPDKNEPWKYGKDGKDGEDCDYDYEDN